MKDKDYKKLIGHLKLNDINFLDFSQKILAAASIAFESEQETIEEIKRDCEDLGVPFRIEDFEYEPGSLSDERLYGLLQGLREVFIEF